MRAPAAQQLGSWINENYSGFESWTDLRMSRPDKKVVRLSKADREQRDNLVLSHIEKVGCVNSNDQTLAKIYDIQIAAYNRRNRIGCFLKSLEKKDRLKSERVRKSDKDIGWSDGNPYEIWYSLA